MAFVIPETITEEELIRILKAIEKPKLRLAFVLGFYACMRVSEVIKLREEHIDRGQRIIRIKSAKGQKDRNIPIPPQALRGLRELPINCTARLLQMRIKEYGKKVLKKDIHFHTLRHSGATYYLNKKKWSTRQVQQLLGHSRIVTTEIYTHVTPADLVDQMWEEKK